jgi:hypothetical protein
MTTEKELRIHLREEFVDSGFIQVFQWRNFEDYFNIELNKAKKEERDKLKTQVLDKIDELNDEDSGDIILFKKELKSKLKEIFER